jgi:RNA 3'-terminal phosphate cyclase-like protein
VNEDKKRGSPPPGGGEVLFLCPIVKQVKTHSTLSNLEKLSAYEVSRTSQLCTPLYTQVLQHSLYRHAVRVSPQFSNRMIEAARSVLNRYIPDIYLYSDVYKGEDSGKYVQIVRSQARSS